jgi:hypothetical protein
MEGIRRRRERRGWSIVTVGGTTELLRGPMGLGGDMIRMGLTSEWERGPPPNNIDSARQREFQGEAEKLIIEQIEGELKEGVIKEVRREEVRFLSQVGVIKKKGGKTRKILEAQDLNKYLVRKKFKMEDA